MAIGDDLMYVDNDKDEDQDFTAMKEPDQKKRYVFVNEVGDLEDDSPYKYRHIQTGPRSIRPEYYTVDSILQSEYHMSDHQSDGAIIVVANHLFGRKKYGKLKKYIANSETTKNALSAHSNRRRVEVLVETMALHMVVEELMRGEACVIYSNDGPAQRGMGNYVVQSLSIYGVQRNLSTFGIFTEKRETLADLVKCTIQILSAASAYKYSSSDILKITFVMSDNTAHNLKVMEKVCEDEDVEKNPLVFLCNIHPLMMFQRKIK